MKKTKHMSWAAYTAVNSLKHSSRSCSMATIRPMIQKKKAIAYTVTHSGAKGMLPSKGRGMLKWGRSRVKGFVPKYTSICMATAIASGR